MSQKVQDLPGNRGPIKSAAFQNSENFLIGSHGQVGLTYLDTLWFNIKSSEMGSIPFQSRKLEVLGSRTSILRDLVNDRYLVLWEQKREGEDVVKYWTHFYSNEAGSIVEETMEPIFDENYSHRMNVFTDMTNLGYFTMHMINFDVSSLDYLKSEIKILRSSSDGYQEIESIKGPREMYQFGFSRAYDSSIENIFFSSLITSGTTPSFESKVIYFVKGEEGYIETDSISNIYADRHFGTHLDYDNGHLFVESRDLSGNFNSDTFKLRPHSIDIYSHGNNTMQHECTIASGISRYMGYSELTAYRSSRHFDVHNGLIAYIEYNEDDFEIRIARIDYDNCTLSEEKRLFTQKYIGSTIPALYLSEDGMELLVSRIRLDNEWASMIFQLDPNQTDEESPRDDYPLFNNVFTDEIKLKTSESPRDMTLYDTLGRLVKRSKSSLSMSGLEHLSAGNYFLVLQGEGEILKAYPVVKM